MEWGENFPEDCPPQDAIASSDKVYRFLDGDCITASDFIDLFFEVMNPPSGM
jgi:hypothetical protein